MGDGEIRGGLRRREFLKHGAVAAGALAAGPALWRSALGAETALAGPRIGNGPYGPLQPQDLNGIMLPNGFTAKEIARGLQPVGLTGYPWHPSSDASGSLPQPGGGWIFAANSELPSPGGGASAIRFKADGTPEAAYRILQGSDTNCGGGITSWGTWLSGEEVARGLVWECDITGQAAAVQRPALGRFSHEYIVVHETERRIYLTEDESGGGFYRFTPSRWGDLSAGTLEIATLRKDGFVDWSRVPDPAAGSTPTRNQVPAASHLNRPEGLCIDHGNGIVYFVESSAGRIFAYDPGGQTYQQIYDEKDYKGPILTDPDNIAVSQLSGDLFVCEDAGDLDICIITPEGEIAKFVHLSGTQHGDPSTEATSETTGPSFDPSGNRFYFSSQRAYTVGAVYEVTGPFRRGRPSGSPALLAGLLKLRIGIDAPGRIRRKRLARRGLRVVVRLNRRANVSLALEVPRRKRRRRRRRAHRSARRVSRLVAIRKRLPAGRTKLRLRPRRRARAYLRRRRRSVTATLVATARTDSGERAVARRRIRILV